MLTSVHPKLPMRNKAATREFYINKLGFQDIGSVDYDDYLMVKKDNVEIHFFKFETLSPNENYGGIYIRTDTINDVYNAVINNSVPIHPNGPLQNKPWGQREFALLDPDNNLLIFGERLT